MADEQRPDDRQTIVLLAILVEGGLIVLAWALGWLLDRLPLQTFAWDPLDALCGVLATVPMLLLFLTLLRWPIGPLARIKQFSEEVIRPLLMPCSLLDLLGISVLAGLGEEMLFRGVFQGALQHWMRNPWLALALASVLFGLLHAITYTYAVLAALMGAYLGWLWWYTDNLLAVVITHALYDFLVLVYLLRGPGATAAEIEPPEASTEKEALPVEKPADSIGNGE
jgi:membrane protease YdiL (CAAX protease family)